MGLDGAMSDCHPFERALRALDQDPAAARLSDELALHLDRCVRCRQLFDRGKVEIPSAGFEVLALPARRRILEALATARAARPRRRGIAIAAAAVLVVAATAAVLHE